MGTNETLALLQICDLAKEWPNLKAMHDLAMDELNKLNLDAQKELARRAEVKAKEEAAAKAKAAAEAKAEAERRSTAEPRAIPADTAAPASERRI